jgi:hypothetical protein
MAGVFVIAGLSLSSSGHCKSVPLPGGLQEQVDHLIALISDGYAVPYSEATRALHVEVRRARCRLLPLRPGAVEIGAERRTSDGAHLALFVSTGTAEAASVM